MFSHNYNLPFLQMLFHTEKKPDGQVFPTNKIMNTSS